MDLKQVAQFGVCGFLGSADMRATGVVNQHVDAAMAGDDVPDRRVDGGGVGHVERQDIDLAGVSRRQVIQ